MLQYLAIFNSHCVNMSTNNNDIRTALQELLLYPRAIIITWYHVLVIVTLPQHLQTLYRFCDNSKCPWWIIFIFEDSWWAWWAQFGYQRPWVSPGDFCGITPPPPPAVFNAQAHSVWVAFRYIPTWCSTSNFRALDSLYFWTQMNPALLVYQFMHKYRWIQLY